MRPALLLPLALLAGPALAGLGPDDVMVLYNADDGEAVETANQYAVARDLPDAQLCGVSGIDPSTRDIDLDTFDASIRVPLEACIDALTYPDDIDAIVIVRGLPYRVDLPAYRASLAAMLQVGRSVRTSDGAEIAGLGQLRNSNFQASISNPTYIMGGTYSQDTTASYGANGFYMTSPRIVRGEDVPGPFRRSDVHELAGNDFTGELYIVTRLDGFDHTDARALIDRAVQADGAFPDAPFMCMRGADGARGVRDAECEHALRMIDAAGGETEWISAFDGELSGLTVMSYWTGAANMRGAIDGVTYAPGAIADNLTSFGAAPANFFCDETGETCPGNESQTSMLRFIRAGASATQGTVAEPLNNVFPNAGTLVLYHQGYTLGESWLYNMRYLHWVNTWVGDPLMAPFAERPVVEFAAEVAENQPLDVIASHPDGIAALTVYVDGERVQDPDDPSLPGMVPADWGAVEGDSVEVFAVAVAAPPVAAPIAGWPAAAPVSFNPGTKGWTRTTVTIGAPVLDEVEDDDGGCGCNGTPGGALLLGWIALLPLWRRRHRRAAWPG